MTEIAEDDRPCDWGDRRYQELAEQLLRQAKGRALSWWALGGCSTA